MNENTIYKRQMAFLILILTFTFKVSYLPTLVVTQVKSSGVLLMALYLIPEVLMFFVIYKFVNINGMSIIEANEKKGVKIVYKIIMAILTIYFTLRLALMYSGTVMFVIEIMFENIIQIEIAYTLIIPLIYIAYKGIRTISRTAEILTWISTSILIINYVFLKTELNLYENFPLLNDSFLNFIKQGSVFWFWFGDFTPFIFLTLKNSKRSYIIPSLLISVFFILFAYMTMYSIYGNSAAYLSNLIVKLAGFNQFGNKLGRLDWTGIIAWFMMSILYLAIYLWAAVEAGTRVVNKRGWVMIAIVLSLVALETFLEDHSKIVFFVLTDVRYIAVLSNYLIPSILLFLALQFRKNMAKNQQDLLMNLKLKPDTEKGQ